MVHVNPQLSTGLSGLDLALRGLIPGDNVVWHVGAVEGYAPFVEPYGRSALERGRRLVYLRFADHPALVAPQDGLEVHHLDADAVVQRAKKLKSETVAEPGAEQETGDWEEQKRRRSNHRKLLSNRDKVTEQIDTTETRLKQIQEQYCVAGFFEQTPPAEIETLRAEETALNTDLEQLMLDWERIETELAALGESN